MDNTIASLLTLLRISLDSTDNTASGIVEMSNDAVHIAYHQEVVALVYYAIQKLYESGYDAVVDKDIKLRLVKQALTQESQYKSNLKSMKKISDLFESEGIIMYVLKGVSIAQYYPQPQYRFSCDMDCLLADLNKNHFESRFEEGNVLIESKGVSVHRDYYKHSDFRVGSLYVENHKFCCSVKRGKRTKELETYLQGLLNPNLAEKMDGLYFPSLMFQAIFLIEHACSHFLYEKINLKHMCDWAMFRKANIDLMDWPEFRKQCEKFKLLNFVDAMNSLADVILGNKEYAELTSLERRVFDDSLQVVTYVESKSIRRFRKAFGILKSGWKFKHFGHSSMIKELVTSFFAYMFENDPKLTE